MDQVAHVILVLSGKGGVGKSTVSSQLALALKETGFKVGLLDIDLCGPSIPFILNLEDSEVHLSAENSYMTPVYTDESKCLAVMSLGFLLNSRNDAVIWRGPKKTGMIKSFLEQTSWGKLDYLIIDTPPGTSDEHITVMENLKALKCDGAILVTTPQQVAIEDVRKEITFCKKTGIYIIGIIENMSGFVCPNCEECTNIFSSGGGESLAEITNIPFLGRLPIDPKVGKLAGTGKSVISEFPNSESSKTFKELVNKISTKKSTSKNDNNDTTSNTDNTDNNDNIDNNDYMD